MRTGGWQPTGGEPDPATLFPNPPDVLTALEHEVMDLTGILAGKLREMIGAGPNGDSDWNEIAGHLHVIQATVLAQAACRVYPRRYRLLGQKLT